MKAALIVAAMLAGMVMLLRSDESRLEVHEWGTFTVLSGSDGTPLRWYQPWADQARLPGFVHVNPLGFKSLPAYLRMETPVLYFYPSRKMDVTAKVEMRNGRITEWFPAVAGPAISFPQSPEGHTVHWEGTLLPPDATVDMPTPPGTNPYFRARAVPDAWYFSAAPPTVPAFVSGPPNLDTLHKEGPKKLPPQVDKFIFYRGAGDAVPPVRASVSGSSVTLSGNPLSTGISAAFALRASPTGLLWCRLPALPAIKASDKGDVSTSLDPATSSRSSFASIR